jgi:hypothetical protein
MSLEIARPKLTQEWEQYYADLERWVFANCFRRGPDCPGCPYYRTNGINTFSCKHPERPKKPMSYPFVNQN